MAPTDPAWKGALADNVKRARAAANFTQRQLADTARLSLRLIADVERGRANPSLSSLHDLARALRVDVGDLVRVTDPRRPVALLGLRGAGKSTIGKKVARGLGWPFVEVDAEIERAAGMKLAELFALHGEAHYRTLEQRVLVDVLAAGARVVVATGGGVVMHPESYSFLKARALTVWLRTTPQEHWDRVVAQGDKRPMAQRAQARAELEALYRARAPLYAEAELVVDTTKLGPDAAAARVLAAAR